MAQNWISPENLHNLISNSNVAWGHTKFELELRQICISICHISAGRRQICSQQPNISELVIATVSNSAISFHSILEVNWYHCNSSYQLKQPSHTKTVVFGPVPHCLKLRTLAPIQHLSFHDIAIRYVCQLCSVGCAFISSSAIYNAIHIG